MEDICSDWESYDEAEQMTKQPETKAYNESKNSILRQDQTQKEEPQLQQQQSLQYHQNTQYNQQVQHYQIQQRQLPKKDHLERPKNEPVEKQQSKKKSNAYLKPNE